MKVVTPGSITFCIRSSIPPMPLSAQVSMTWRDKQSGIQPIEWKKQWMNEWTFNMDEWNKEWLIEQVNETNNWISRNVLFSYSVAGKVIITLAFGSFFFTYIFSLDMRTAFWFGVQLCLRFYDEIMQSLIYMYVRTVALLTDQPFVIRPAQFERG